MSLTRKSVAKPIGSEQDFSPDRPPFQRSGAVAPCLRAGTFRRDHPAPNTLRHCNRTVIVDWIGDLDGAHRRSGSPRPPVSIRPPVILDIRGWEPDWIYSILRVRSKKFLPQPSPYALLFE